MHAGARRSAWSALAVVLGLGLAMVLSGCDLRAGSSVREVAMTTRSGCPTAYPEQLALDVTRSEATPPLGGLLACTGHPATGPVLLHDGGRAAWRVSPGPHASRVVGGTAWTRWLRGHTAVPDTVVLPGESALVWAPVGSVTFRLDRDWSAAWTSLDAGLQALPATGHDSRAALAAPASSRGRALVTCALTALHLRRTPTLVGPAPSSPPPTPYSVVPSTPSAGPAATPPGGRESPLRGLSGLDAVQMTWNPITTACSGDWQRSDRRLAAGGATAVRWWTAWQRADNWLAQVARELQWLDHDGEVTLRLGS